MADELGVGGLGEVFVFGAFDDGAAVAEDGDVKVAFGHSDAEEVAVGLEGAEGG